MFLSVCVCVSVCVSPSIVARQRLGKNHHNVLCILYHLAVCVSACVCPHNCFVFYVVRVVSKKSRRLVSPRTSCYIIRNILNVSLDRSHLNSVSIDTVWRQRDKTKNIVLLWLFNTNDNFCKLFTLFSRIYIYKHNHPTISSKMIYIIHKFRIIRPTI
jgi:hypothetical protein